MHFNGIFHSKVSFVGGNFILGNPQMVIGIDPNPQMVIGIDPKNSLVTLKLDPCRSPEAEPLGPLRWIFGQQLC